MERSGQYTIIEQTLLFGVGITLALGFMIAFEDLSGDLREDAADTQTELLAEYMAANIIQLVESGATGQITLTLPSTLATQQYTMQLDSTGVTVQTTGARATASLHGLEDAFELGGDIVSRDNSIAIERTGNRIQLEAE